MKTSSTAQATKNARGERLARLGLGLEDFAERFTRSSGPGGQHVNKVSTAVTVTCARENAMVTVQDHRSQAMNRDAAWERVLAVIEKARRTLQQERKGAREKLRRQNAKRPAGLKRRILADKKKHGETKKLRRRVEAA